jgi:hypothetical protein
MKKLPDKCLVETVESTGCGEEGCVLIGSNFWRQRRKIFHFLIPLLLDIAKFILSPGSLSYSTQAAKL